ncbi:uncharacterized protein LOC108487911 [Gossypium arboreum]|uniref:uncharacterized protein LOC108487911 n=1 Tax=Gossypium arboreum TaxID=29729 RepID=UPI0008192F71|nr:uncharacterized protein LOC108487911 [Gossypium arboreum]
MTDLRAMFTRLSLFDNGSLLAELQVESGNTVDFGLNSEGVFCFRGRICVQKDTELRQSILREVHNSPYAMHLGGNKMYQDLRESYWWPGLKRELERVTIEFVSGLPLTATKNDSVWVIVDQLTKSAHFIPIRIDYTLQKLAKLYVSKIVRLHGIDGQLDRVIQILEDILMSCVIHFYGSWENYLPLAEFSYNNSYHFSIQMALYEALHGRRCRTSSCWTELGERQVLGLEVVFDIEDKVLRFGRKGNLSPRFIGPNPILKRVGLVAYQLELPPELDQIHNIFHVSMLRRYHSDPTHIFPIKEIEVRPDLTFEEEPVQILDQDVKVLRRKSIPLVNVLWHNHSSEEATWEPKVSMR